MSINQEMDKADVVHIYNGYYLAIKKNIIMPSAATWTDTENINLSEVKERQVSHIINMWKLIRNDTKELIHKTETEISIPKLVVAKGEA